KPDRARPRLPAGQMGQGTGPQCQEQAFQGHSPLPPPLEPFELPVASLHCFLIFEILRSATNNRARASSTQGEMSSIRARSFWVVDGSYRGWICFLSLLLRPKSPAFPIGNGSGAKGGRSRRTK